MYCRTAVQPEPICVADEVARLRQADPGCAGGAQVTFEGTVRAGDGVARLYLEHYPGMTEQALEALARDAATRWSLTGVVLIHRVGWLDPGEVIVQVTTGAPHRRDAFDACCFLVDALKTDVPLWKKHRHANGSESWVESRPNDLEARAAWSGPGKDR